MAGIFYYYVGLFVFSQKVSASAGQHSLKSAAWIKLVTSLEEAM